MDQKILVGGLEEFLNQSIKIHDEKDPIKPPIISEYAVTPIEEIM